MAARFSPLGARGGVLFSPGFMAPFGWERRTVVTVHDLHYLDRSITTAGHERYFRRVIVPQLRRCRRVLTVSDHSAAELHEVLGDAGAERADIVVVGGGVDPLFAESPPAPARVVPRLVFVGGDKTNKNLAAALRAVGSVVRQLPVELVVVGDVAPALRSTAPPEVSFVGAIGDVALAALYASSTALLMPSIGEGFGLPALESLVAGTPVVFGRRGALPDLVGEWGWGVDPFDDDSVAAGIESAISEPIEVPLAVRQGLLAAHRWDDVACRVVTAIEEVL